MGPRLFSIPAGAPFLDVLADALLDGRLVPGFGADDPFALADTTLYLPTRRAARAVRESFLKRLGRPLLLPNIRTLGDIDEDEPGGIGDGIESLPPAISAMERQLVLMRLVLGWSGALVRAAADLPDEELVVPASPADAARLAATLGRLIDQVGAAPEAWSGLFSGVPADLARYWQITLEFLRIATEHWPQHLAERELLDPGARRDLLLRAEAARLAAEGSPGGPVIAAGSTGSVPATAALLAAIARLPNGAVVLPGLDRELDAESWAEIGPSERDPAGAGHPQYGLKLLLESLGAEREDVAPLGDAPAPLVARARVLSEAMRPAATTERWSEASPLAPAEKAEALREVGIVEAANEREEALAVAVILREATETPGRTAALVTPDRGLARRVAVELARWGISADDSAGQPLGKTPPGVLARLTADVGLHGGEATALLALLKHPLAGFGLSRAEVRRGARALERAVLRGPRLRPGLAAIRHALAVALAERDAREDGRWQRSVAARHLSRSRWEAVIDLAARAEAAFRSLENLTKRSAVPLADMVAAHDAALRAIVADEHGGSALGGSDPAAEALTSAFEELAAGASAGPEIAPRDYPGLFSALFERDVVRRRGGLDPRIHIWGALEARLQSADIVVLSGLNEGTWPSQSRLDPLLSRPMRAALALEPPERRIGLAAHDFAQALGHRRVWLTRAKRQDNEPRVASRWLQRLVAYAGSGLAEEMAARGLRILALSRRLDRPLALDRPLRPRPSPPVALRPTRLSATSIETLIRDPYAIYAREVLRLRPFEPIAKLPEAAERGTLIHDVLEKFVRERPAGPFDAAGLEQLLAIGRDAFGEYADFPEVLALWWPRFERVAAWFMQVEAARPDVVHRHVEGSGAMEVTPDFLLRARADRLDRMADGGIAIIDYKTGAPPPMNEVLALSPQLPLEGLIVRRGGFEGIAAAEPAELLYYRLSGRGDGGEVQNRSYRAAKGGKPEVTLPQALAMTQQRLLELVAHFASPEAEYLSRKIPKRGRVFVGDYDHLARVAEWVASESEEYLDI